MFTCCQISTREQIRINFPSQTHWNLGQWCETHFQLLHCHSHNTITLHFYENYLVSETIAASWVLHNYHCKGMVRHMGGGDEAFLLAPESSGIEMLIHLGFCFCTDQTKNIIGKHLGFPALMSAWTWGVRASLHFWINILHLGSILVWNKDSKWKRKPSDQDIRRNINP